MQSIVEPLLIAAAFWVAWDYRRPVPLLPLLRRSDLVPVTLEDQRTVEWLALLAPHPGTRGRHSAWRRGTSDYTARHYTKD